MRRQLCYAQILEISKLRSGDICQDGLTCEHKLIFRDTGDSHIICQEKTTQSSAPTERLVLKTNTLHPINMADWRLEKAAVPNSRLSKEN